MFICEISVITTLICQKLWSVKPIQQKNKLPSPKVSLPDMMIWWS